MSEGPGVALRIILLLSRKRHFSARSELIGTPEVCPIPHFDSATEFGEDDALTREVWMKSALLMITFLSPGGGETRWTE